MDLELYLKDRVKQVDAALGVFLPAAKLKPATLHKAMRYSIFAGGKRLRPVLVLAAAEACGGSVEKAMQAACAVECVHTYSLIHDDLPCMDNDDYRRGKLTNHKVFGEGIAVLAGDALLTSAFEILAETEPTKRYSVADYVREFAFASGSLKLLAGQVADIEAEGKTLKRKDLDFIHGAKTAALIMCSVRLGAMTANATPRQLALLTEFGENLGLAFQVIDDILDMTQTSDKLGKSAGKDAAVGKATYPAILGLERSRIEAKRFTDEAISALKSFGKSSSVLQVLALDMLEREY